MILGLGDESLRVDWAQGRGLCSIPPMYTKIDSWPAIATHRPLSSSFWGLPYRILKINHKRELLRGLWVATGWLASQLGREVGRHVGRSPSSQVGRWIGGR